MQALSVTARPVSISGDRITLDFSTVESECLVSQCTIWLCGSIPREEKTGVEFTNGKRPGVDRGSRHPIYLRPR